MALTRLQVETLLVGPDGLTGSCGRLCVLFHLYDPAADGFAVGSIPALSGPIAAALRAVDLYATDPTTVTDADLADVTNADLSVVLETARLHLLESCLGNADVWTSQQGMEKDDWNQRIKDLREWITAKREELSVTYGLDASSLTSGTIDLGFPTEGGTTTSEFG